MQIEVGQQSIKQRRAETRVLSAPGGTVADYAPFYYAPRSPMMHNIHSGKVPSYRDGCDRLIYLATHTQRLVEAGLTWLATDRNAVLSHAEFSADDARLTEMIDWDVMELERCFPVPEHPDRIERRMAEFLVHEQVPFDQIMAVGVKSTHLQSEVDAILSGHGSSLRGIVRPTWYF